MRSPGWFDTSQRELEQALEVAECHTRRVERCVEQDRPDPDCQELHGLAQLPPPVRRQGPRAGLQTRRVKTHRKVARVHQQPTPSHSGRMLPRRACLAAARTHSKVRLTNFHRRPEPLQPPSLCAHDEVVVQEPHSQDWPTIRVLDGTGLIPQQWVDHLLLEPRKVRGAQQRTQRRALGHATQHLELALPKLHHHIRCGPCNLASHFAGRYETVLCAVHQQPPSLALTSQLEHGQRHVFRSRSLACLRHGCGGLGGARRGPLRAFHAIPTKGPLADDRCACHACRATI
mmetsp:Transcript_15222/g.48477  ORF Transcript_15222/g.48477 Transcript_15222/m.48477 type:complete len:288 (-) Transcript_15222:1508-2371(-)